VKPQETGKLTFQHYQSHKDDSEDQEYVILHLTPRQCVEVSATKREGVFHAIKVLIAAIQILSNKDSIETFGNVLARLLFEYRHNIGVKEIVLARGTLLQTQCVYSIR
jgi:hypothetical protein